MVKLPFLKFNPTRLAMRNLRNLELFELNLMLTNNMYPKSSRRKTKQFSSYFRFPTSHTTVHAVPHTAVSILGAIRCMNPSM